MSVARGTGCWELKLGLLEKQQVLLSAGPPLQPGDGHRWFISFDLSGLETRAEQIHTRSLTT